LEYQKKKIMKFYLEIKEKLWNFKMRNLWKSWGTRSVIVNVLRKYDHKHTHKYTPNFTPKLTL